MSLQEKMRWMRHLTIGQQVDELNDTLRGHYAYYGVGGNICSLQKVHRHVERYWFRMLRSRSWAGRRFSWTDFHQLKAFGACSRSNRLLSLKCLVAIDPRLGTAQQETA
jgi:hypothetical protein